MLRKLCFSLLLLFCMIHCITAETIDTSNWKQPPIANWHLTWESAQKAAMQKGKKVLAISYFAPANSQQSSSSNSYPGYHESAMFIKEITQKTEFRNFIDKYFEVFSLQCPGRATPESQRQYYWNTLRKMGLGSKHPGFSVLNTEGSVCERIYNYESMTKLITFLEKAVNSSPGDYKSREGREHDRLKELFKSAEFEIIGWGTDHENITSDGKLPETLNSKQQIFIKARYSLPEGVRVRCFSCFANTRRFRSLKYGTFEKNGTVIFSTYTGENGLIKRITFYAGLPGVSSRITVKEIPCHIEVKEGAAVSSPRNTASRRSSSSSSVSSPRQESGSTAAGSDWVKPPLPNWHLTWESAQKAAMQKGKKVLAISSYGPAYLKSFNAQGSFVHRDSAMFLKEITQEKKFRTFIDKHFEVLFLQSIDRTIPESQSKYYWNALRKMELGWTHPGFSVLNTEGSVCERIYDYESMTKLMTFLEKALYSSPGDYKSREAKERERLKELFKSAEFEIIGWGYDRENITNDGKLPETLNPKQKFFIKVRYSLPQGVHANSFGVTSKLFFFRYYKTYGQNGTVILSPYPREEGLIEQIRFYITLPGVPFNITVKEIPCRIEVKEGAAASVPRNTASRRSSSSSSVSSPRQESGSAAAGSDWVKPPLPNWHLTLESAQKAAREKGKKMLAISYFAPANSRRSFSSNSYPGYHESAMLIKEITQKTEFRNFIDQHFEVFSLQYPNSAMPESQDKYYWKILYQVGLGWTDPGFSVLNTEGSVCERIYNYESMTKLMTFLEKAVNSSPGDYKSREAKERERLKELFKSAEFEIIGWGTDHENITSDGKLPETLNPKQRIFIKARYSLPEGVRVRGFSCFANTRRFRSLKYGTFEKNGTVIFSTYTGENGLIKRIMFYASHPGMPFRITVKEIPCHIEVKEGAAASVPRNTASRKSSSSSSVSSPRQEPGSTAAKSDWVKPPLPNWHLTWESAQKAAMQKGKKILVIANFSRYKQTRIYPYSRFPEDKKLMQLFDTYLETLYLELSSVFSLPEEQKKYNNSVKEKFNLQERSYTIFETDGTQITQLPYYTDMEDLKDFLETGALCTAEELKIIAREKEKENAMLSRQVKIEIIGWGSSREDITLTPQLPAKWEQGKRLYLRIRYEFPPFLRGSITSSRGSTPYLQDRGTTILVIYPKKGDKHIRQLNFSLLTVRPGKTYPLPSIPCSIEIIPEQ